MPQRRWIEHAGSLTAQAFDLLDNDSRRGVLLSNNSDADMTYRVGAEATATIGINLEAGGAVALVGDLCPDGMVSLFCAGTNKAYTVYEIVG